MRVPGRRPDERPRLSGCYSLQPTGTAPAGTWGRLTVRLECSGVWGMPSERDLVTWVGEWFAAGERAVQGVDVHIAALYPVDTIWLHAAGEGARQGAVLRIDRSTDAAAWRIEGWIFPSPGSLAIASGQGGTDTSSVVPSPGPSAAPAASPGPAGTSEVALLPVSELPDDGTHTLGEVATFEQVVSLEVLEATRDWSDATLPAPEGQTRYTFLVQFRHDASRPDLTGYYYFTAFSMRDPDGFEYSLLAADAVRQPMLQSGELAAGEAAQGWLTFVGPSDVPFVDLVYRPVADDRVVFRVGTP